LGLNNYFCVFRVNYLEEASTFVNEPNIQKSKLLLEPQQKTNSNEKKEKIKSTKTELEANLLQNTRILESWKLENC